MNGSPAAVPIIWLGPRSTNSMNGSPAISSENRVHRVQEMQRSRSSSTSDEIGTGLSKVRFSSVNRVSPWPVVMAWFCSGHSPPLSQMGQSSGWLTSSSSMTPRWAFSATGEVSWVRTTMPSVHTVVQEASGLRWPSTSTRHWRQAPIGSSSGWSQNRGIWIPSSSAARMTSVPLGTAISKLSMVTVTGLDRRGATAWHRWLPARSVRLTGLPHTTVEAAGSNGQPPCFWCSRYSSRKYWIEE